MTTYKVLTYDAGEQKIEADTFENENNWLVFYASPPTDPAKRYKVAAFQQWLAVIAVQDHLTPVR